MSHYFYITPEEYAIAQANGIDPANLERRVRLLGYKKEKALTKPLKQHTDRSKWVEVATSNGISYYTFMSRINKYGMSEEEAATKPLQDIAGQLKLMNNSKKRVVPKDLMELAESNGINYHTLRARLKKGMDSYEAATKKLSTRSEIGKLGAKRQREIHGNFNELIFAKKRA